VQQVDRLHQLKGGQVTDIGDRKTTDGVRDVGTPERLRWSAGLTEVLLEAEPEVG
jgi:hypothetical protein